ncbi:hypothetical protein LCGC14_0346450 [marine sediment metagenome]|uniref:Uncharacterized protein n=1 Tax=marine sediment metagenome TaxID=412755 RepID=A0A0F9WK76_9ZZZZ
MTNSIKTYGAMAIAIITLLASIIYGYASLGHQVEDNTKMQPEIKLNSDHRIKFEEKVGNMGEKIDMIWDAVKK